MTISHFSLQLYYSYPSKKSGMKILILSWRDIKHPWQGGSEVYLHEMSKKLIKCGHEVTMFAAAHSNGNISEEIVDGIKIIRKGNFITLYLWAIYYYFARFRNKFDIIIDQHNGIPFFSPAYISSTPVICLVHHVHDKQWFHEKQPWPLSYVGYFLEKYLLPFTYKYNEFVAVSLSTKQELIQKLKIKEDKITVINPAIYTDIKKTAAKSQFPSLIYAGRLKKYKRIDLLIRSLLRLFYEFPKITLHIVGDGDAKAELIDLAERLGIAKSVIFHGYASEKLKRDLMSSSWVLVNPSSHEGWGITIIEAAACQTTSVGSNIPGLRDSIIDNQTGLLFEENSVFDLSGKIKKIISSPGTRYRLEKGAYQFSRKFTWMTAAKKYLKLFKKIMHQEKRQSFFDPMTTKTLDKKNIPLVSVIVPTKNVADFAEICFKSISKQTYPNMEFIVVDNYSTDETYQLAKKYTKKVYTCGPERNQQRNYAVRKAQGKYLMFVDSDMHLDSELVADCVYRLERFNKSVAVTIPEIQVGKSIWSQARRLEKSFYDYDNNTIESPRFFLKSTYVESGGYDEKLLYGEDMELTERIKKLGHIARSVFYVYHDEDRLGWWDIMRKKYRYGKTAEAFFTKNPKKAADTTRTIRPSFIKKWRNFLDNPIVSAAFIFLRFSELTAMGFGYGFFATLALVLFNKFPQKKKIEN